MREQLFKSVNLEYEGDYDELRIELASNEHVDNVPCYVHCRATLRRASKEVHVLVNNVYCYCNCPGAFAVLRHAFVAVNLLRKINYYPFKLTIVSHDLSAYLFMTRQRLPIVPSEHKYRLRLFRAIKSFPITDASFQLGSGEPNEVLESYLTTTVRKAKHIQPTFEGTGSSREAHFRIIRRKQLEQLKLWKYLALTSPD